MYIHTYIHLIDAACEQVVRFMQIYVRTYVQHLLCWYAADIMLLAVRSACDLLMCAVV